MHKLNMVNAFWSVVMCSLSFMGHLSHEGSCPFWRDFMYLLNARFCLANVISVSLFEFLSFIFGNTLGGY